MTRAKFIGITKCAAQKKLDAAMAVRLGRAVPHWTPHDLRRTVNTGMAGLGIAHTSPTGC
jgi:hypothetical protein